ncbi:MAG: prepilin-type N-terminal cleavage/methylation domain-containing protein [Candidatus Omnitrophota bacterium]
MKRTNAFTLVEVLISSSIFLIVLVTVYSAFHAGVFGYRNIEDRIALFQAGRFILERIQLDLRNSFAYSKDQTRFLGLADEISFLTLIDTFWQNTLIQEVALVSYSPQGDKLMRLCKRGKLALDEKSGVAPDEMVQGLQELNFEYGYIDPIDKSLKFKDSWVLESEQKTFPVAVRIKLVLRNKTVQDFERTIYLPITAESP